MLPTAYPPGTELPGKQDEGAGEQDEMDREIHGKALLTQGDPVDHMARFIARSHRADRSGQTPSILNVLTLNSAPVA